MKIFWVKLKSTMILSFLAKKIFFTCSKIKLFTILWYLWLQKVDVQKNFSPSSGAVVGSGMDKNQDPGSGINIANRNTGSKDIYFLMLRAPGGRGGAQRESGQEVSAHDQPAHSCPAHSCPAHGCPAHRRAAQPHSHQAQNGNKHSTCCR
jgi:hypothetical protein